MATTSEQDIEILRQRGFMPVPLPKMNFVPFDLSPTDFGFDLPQIPKIHIGDCGGTDKKRHWYKDVGMDWAHTHGCMDDPMRFLICIRRPHFLLVKNGLMLKHEVAHVLANLPIQLCQKTNATPEDYTKFFHYVHGPEWQEEMEKMGLPTDPLIYLTPEEINGKV